jgi:hypothetical protein
MEELSLERTVLQGARERLRVIVLAGAVLGVVVGGVGGRLAMLLLRATSNDSVRGTISDDGFEIGRFTLGGTYSLLALGAAIGIIGSAAYGLVAPSLIGPRWFRHLTCALGAGAVVGSMLVHADGIDFTLLTPTWLAIALFIAVPAAFGLLIGPTRSLLQRGDLWINTGRRRWWIPLIVVGGFPVSLFPSAIVACAVFASGAVRVSNDSVRGSDNTSWLLRTAWLLIAVLGLLALVGDVRDIVSNL